MFACVTSFQIFTMYVKTIKSVTMTHANVFYVAYNLLLYIFSSKFILWCSQYPIEFASHISFAHKMFLLVFRLSFIFPLAIYQKSVELQVRKNGNMKLNCVVRARYSS